jgi:TnpA family transposase
VPVQFLSDEQARRYGSFHGDPSAEQLSRFFSFGPEEQEDINRHRDDRARLGYAVQLGCVRFLGCFPDLAATPASVVSHVADGVGVKPAAFATYPTSRTRFAHAVDIRARYGFTPFGEGLPHGLFLQWLDDRVWTAAERPTVLVDLATVWLVEHKVLLPGITTLTRLIAEVRDRAARRSWRIVGAQVDDAYRVRLERLLDVEVETGLSLLERLRRPPRSPTIDGLVGALNRLGEVQRVAGSRRLRLDGLAPGRVRALAADAASSKAQRLSQRTPERRLASLACFADRLLAEASDDVIDVLLIVVHDLASRSERAVERNRIRTLDQLDAAALVLRKAALGVLDPDVTDVDLRSAIFGLMAREELQRAVDVVGELLGAGPDQALQRLLARYPHVRRFLPALLDRVRFASVTASHPVIAALDHLRALETGAEKVDAAPRSVITEAWRPLVVVEGRVDRRGYTLCVLDRLRLALRRRDVYVVDGDRWGDPRRLLVEPATWRSVGRQIMRTLDLPDRAPSYLERLGAELDTAYFGAADAVAKDPTMWIEESGHRDRVHLAHLDRLSEPASTSELRAHTHALLPEVELPELLLEVHAWTGFLDEFTHGSGAATRIKDLALSVCAVLVAQACNIGYRPVARRDDPALTPARLEWVVANFVRPETLVAANNRLIAYHQTIDLTRRWGSGEIASADGLRFVVPVRSVHAGANPHYFGTGRGVTYYNWSSDQFTSWAAIVIPGTMRDSQFILDGLLDNTSVLQPREVMADTAADSYLIHGLFRLLGYQFSPRLADLPERRYWRLNPRGDYGAFNRVATNRIRRQLIEDNWSDICRVAGTLQTKAATASDVIRVLQRSGQPTTLGRAIAELGRIVQTITMLAYVSDEAARRRVLVQLNRTEARHDLARAVFHGRRGDLYQAYRAGQEDQLGALGLVVNAIALFNTRYMDRAIGHVQDGDRTVDDHDLERLSPLVRQHIELHGRYSFSLPETVRTGELRPLPRPG